MNNIVDNSMIDIYINKQNKYLNKEIYFIIKKCIKSLIKIYNRHIYMISNNNVNKNYISKIDNYGKVLYIDYYKKNDNIKINVYENINYKKIKKKIKTIDEFNDYSFVLLNIYDNKNKMYNIFSTYDFRIIIEDVRAIISLKLLLKIKNIEIKNIFQDFKPSVLEIIYEILFLNNKKQKIINDNFKICIKSLKTLNLLTDIINRFNIKKIII